MSKKATPAKLRSGEWGARVKGKVEVGDVVTITTRSGKSWPAKISNVVWSGDGVSICATESMDGGPSKSKSNGNGSSKTGFVGEKGEKLSHGGRLCSRFEASKADRTPDREIGEACYLRDKKNRIPVIVVGYEPATYMRASDAEDMGHFGLSSGWYGWLHYRKATEEEAEALASSPAEVERREREAAAKLREERLRELDAFFYVHNLTEDPVPAGSREIKPTPADRGVIWSGAAGHRALYLGADGAAWRSTSSYDDFPRAWRSEDPRAIELAKLLLGEEA